MYVPAHFAVDEAAVGELLTRHGAADLVTVTDEGLVATMLPFAYVPEAGTRGSLYGHLARNNPQWKQPARGESLAIVRGPDAYISPRFYASKAEHGRVVPTWNYVTAHVYGQLIIRFAGPSSQISSPVTGLRIQACGLRTATALNRAHNSLTRLR